MSGSSTAQYTRPADQNIINRVNEHKKNRPVAGSAFPDPDPKIFLTRYNKEGLTETFYPAGELKGLRVVMFTVPGAWTKTCTKQHLAGFKEAADKIFKSGIRKIICVCPDKVDVAKAWNDEKGDPRIEMWADNEGKLTDALGFGLNMSGDRAQGMGMVRTAAVINNGNYEWLEIEGDPRECVISHATNVLKHLGDKG